MRVAIFGTGYVGLVTGTCFAEMGNVVACIDIDAEKIARLQRGECPIYEPGLPELLSDNLQQGRLRFTADCREGLADAEAAFICVGTPMGEDGRADLRFVEAAARDIGRTMTAPLLVVTKSTVPVGTAERVLGWVREELARRGVELAVEVASNPEFLKEGSAVEDFMKPDRVVVGVASSRAAALLHELYAPFIRNGLRFYTMDIRSAEMTKYAANGMLATKISFINEIANICELVGADVRQVRLGVGADSRIGLQFLHPGVGYGGSCFPKDVRALIRTAEEHGYRPRLLTAVDQVNREQVCSVQRKLRAWCELHERRLAELTVAVWGLAFKPNTDDVREAPALGLVRDLVAAGAAVRAYDPKAMHEARRALGELPRVVYCQDMYEATEGADVLCLMTEWRPFRRPDFRRLAGQLMARTIFDGRNQYDEARCREYGLTVYPIGVPSPLSRAATRAPS
ncbi:MAG: UDP-glucose/GDP-mannose dehydrogenase family protein [Planctomycetota bacterium]|nr:UDP-glucose/GDP-mannose dehydrogenase family protein [Planctomycetota bacterium]MCX8040224.1 UDP-glucose/GDP-mannose dehydrogenase family protein [Planctomycetota bacterium]MDW8372481.1 UDP-glucose/GDP-mannose dehydrogenase family protein [Planctomycetota bacterium]